MKNYKIILIVLISILILTNVTFFIFGEINLSEINLTSTDPSIIGSNENGTVHKYILGNNSTNDTVVIILGVHNLESGIHNTTNQTLHDLNKSLTKKYIVYFIDIDESKVSQNSQKYNMTNYTANRNMGETLGSQFVIEDIPQYNPSLVLDIHEMEEYYDNTTFILPISTDNISMEIGREIANNMNMEFHSTYNYGSSPEYITGPLADKGITTVIFEVNQSYTPEIKLDYSNRLIQTIDGLNI